MLESPAQFMAKFAVNQAGSPMFGDNVVVCSRKKVLMVPIKLSYQTLKAVSSDGVADLAAYGNSDSRCRQHRCLSDDHKVGSVRFLPLSGKPKKVRPVQKPFVLRKP